MGLLRTHGRLRDRTDFTISSYSFAFLLFFFIGAGKLSGQSDLTLSTEDTRINDHGSYDFLIPASIDTLIYPEISFVLQGADGGRARYVSSLGVGNKERGGGGALVEISFALGFGSNKLSPGGLIRFIVGERGENCSQNASCGGGGGGGSAILYLHPGTTPPTTNDPPALALTDGAGADQRLTNWVLLAVGGGGGGATVREDGFGNFDFSTSGGEGQTNRQGQNGGDFGNGSANPGGVNGNDGTDSGLANAGHGYLTAGRLQQGADESLNVAGGSGYGNGGGTKKFEPGGGGGGGFSGGGAGENGGSGGGGGTFQNDDAISSSATKTNDTRFPEDGFVRYRFLLDDTPGNAPVARCVDDFNVVLTGGQPTTLTPADFNDGSTDPTGFDLTYQMCQTADGTEYFCRDSRTWECDEVGDTEPWVLAVSNGYQTSYCEVSLRIVEAESAPVCPFTGRTVVNLQGACSQYYSATELAHQNVIDCADEFPDVELLLPDGSRTSPDDFFTSGYSFGAGLTTVVYQTQAGNCAYAIEVRTDGGSIALSCPPLQDIDIGAGECEVTVPASQLALNYSGPGTITYRVSPETLSPETEGSGQLPDFTFERGSSQVRYSVEEPGGCSNFCSFAVRVNWEATEASDFACQDVSYPFSFLDLDFREAYQAGVISATDDCGNVPARLAVGFLTGCAQIDIPQPVTVRFGNGAFEQECTFNLTLTSDFTPNCPVNPLFVDLGDAFPQALLPEDVANWEDSPAITATSSLPLLDCDDVGRRFITVTLEDECGNSDSCVRDVRIRDVSRPTLNCRNITRSLDGNSAFLLGYADVLVSAEDNCGAENLAFTLEQELFTCDDLGANTFRLTAEDASSNTSSCLVTVTVTDDVAPRLSCFSSATVELNDDGRYAMKFSDLVASVSDNCGQGFFFSPNTLDCSDLGPAPVPVTVVSRDRSDNVTTCTVPVSIVTPDCPCIGPDGVLVVNNPENVALCADLTVNGIRFVEGNLNLAGYTLTVDNGGRVLDEGENRFVADLSGGKIVTLNTTDNFLDLVRDFGLELFVSDDLAFPRLERSNVPVVIDGFPSIFRVLTVEESFSPVIDDARFYYLDAELNGLAEEELGLYVEQNGVWEAVPVLDRSTADNWVEFSLDFSQLSNPVRFTLTNARALPLVLLDFTGRSAGKTNELKWTTAFEEDFSHFNVERLTGDNTWQTIGAVAGADGAEGEQSQYTFTDAIPLRQSYYRLSMVNLDGSFAFSHTVYVERPGNDEQTGLRFWPNPIDDQLSVRMTGEAPGSRTIALLTLHGTRVRAPRIWSGSGPLTLQFGDLPAGVYLLTVTDVASGQRWTERLVKR